MKNKFLNFKSLILIITLAFTINFLNISANADSNISDSPELLYVTNNAKNDINTSSKKSSGDSLIPQRSQLIWVTDNADVLSDSDIKYVITENRKFAKTSNAEISVLTIENLPEGYDIKTYAYKVFDEWGMNSKEKNNGVLLLIVSGENKTFIARGSGLKISLTTSSIEKNFATSLNTSNNKYMIGNEVLSLATKINTIDKNNSYDTITTKVLYYLLILLAILIFILPVIFFFSAFLKAVSKSSSCKNSMKKATVKITSSTKEPTSSTNETISSGDKAVDAIISEGLTYLKQIKQANNAITDEKISVQITRMEVATDKIFRYIAKHPEDAPQLHKFMNYYLPTLLKLLDSYISLNEQGIKGEHISSTIENIEGILSTIANAFEKQLDNLFADDALDISTDIKVLENMLAQEGLTSDGFKK
jgi:uncharacterized membrane protein YgcG